MRPQGLGCVNWVDGKSTTFRRTWTASSTCFSLNGGCWILGPEKARPASGYDMWFEIQVKLASKGPRYPEEDSEARPRQACEVLFVGWPLSEQLQHDSEPRVLRCGTSI